LTMRRLHTADRKSKTPSHEPSFWPGPYPKQKPAPCVKLAAFETFLRTTGVISVNLPVTLASTFPKILMVSSLLEFSAAIQLKLFQNS
jgi:hypothetical protein